MVTGVTDTGSIADKVAAGQKSLIADQDMFLKLLTAQLKNQDPLSPMDPANFTQQLVQMNGVQQQIMTNQLLQALVAKETSVGDPINMIGKVVTVSTSAALLDEGQASWMFSTHSPAAKVNLQVFDANGKLVWAKTLNNLEAGEHELTWDGRDLTGNQRADGGVYFVKMSATDVNGESVTGEVYQRGVATALEVVNGETLLTLGALRVPLSAVLAVAAAPTTTPTPDPPPPADTGGEDNQTPVEEAA